MSRAVTVTTSDAERVEPAASHGNSHMTSQLLPVMLDHLTYKDNEFNSDGDDDDDDDGSGDEGAAADDGVFQAMNINSTSVVMSSTVSLTSSLPEQTLSTTTNSSHSMTVRPLVSHIAAVLLVSCFMTVALHFCSRDFFLRRDFLEYQ